MKGFVVALAVVAVAVASLPAQRTPPPPACAAPAFHALDFWVGEWEVSDTGGRVIAKSSIGRSHAGCSITEHWMPLQGPDGESISWYTADDSTWHQQWVGGGGWIARFAGWAHDGTVTIVETESSMAAFGKNRMSYTLLPDGRVKQTVDNTTDGGKTWTSQFVGYYRKTG
jgi:hypothetical protein